MTPREQAAERAWHRLMSGASIATVLAEVWQDGYHEGDLDRQRFDRSLIKPKRRAGGGR